MFGSKGSKPETGFTLIAANCEITGDVHFSDQLQINGVIKGNIYASEGAKALVTVTEKGQVRGEIRAPNVVVNGKVEGDIYSDKHVELAAKAEVEGNVYYNLIEMVMGSRVDGKLVHIKTGKEIKQADGPSRESSGDARLAPRAVESRPEVRPQAAQVAAVPGKADYT